jgi:hypothetical protein
LTRREQKANIWHGQPGLLSPFTPFSSSKSLAACARGAGRIVSLDGREIRAEIALRDLTDRFAYDCMWRAEAHGKKGKSGCGVYLPDLEQPRPPDVPPGMVKLRLVKKG